MLEQQVNEHGSYAEVYGDSQNDVGSTMVPEASVHCPLVLQEPVGRTSRQSSADR